MVLHTWPGQCISPGLCRGELQAPDSFQHALGIVWVDPSSVWPFQCTGGFPKMYGRCVEWSEGWMLFSLLRRYSLLFQILSGPHRRFEESLLPLTEHGVKLRPKKCGLFKRQVRYVGRLVTSEGIQVDPNDLEAVMQWKEREPKNVGEVRALLGFLGYYRSFIQDFPE